MIRALHLPLIGVLLLACGSPRSEAADPGQTIDDPSAPATAVAGAPAPEPGDDVCPMPASPADDGAACENAAMRFLRGDGVNQDDGRARILAERGCARGSQPSCQLFAFFLENGRGGPSDPKRALDLYGKACEAEVAAACFNLAAAKEYGRSGAVVDRVEAVALYKKACELGLPPACEDLNRVGNR